MTSLAEMFVVTLVLRLITSSKSMSDDTLKVNTKSVDNRTVDVLMTNESLTSRNRLFRKTTKFKFNCLFDVTSMKDELLMTKLSNDD